MWVTTIYFTPAYILYRSNGIHLIIFWYRIHQTLPSIFTTYIVRPNVSSVFGKITGYDAQVRTSVKSFYA